MPLHSNYFYSRVKVLEFCTPSIVVNSSMNFHEDNLNGFKVIARIRVCPRNSYLQNSKGNNLIFL